MNKIKKINKHVVVLSLIAVIICIQNFQVTAAVPSKSDRIRDKLDSSVVLFIGNSHAIVDNIRKYVDDTNMDVAPLIKGGSTLVPVRFISENFGGVVGFDKLTSSITIQIGSRLVKMAVGSNKMYVNGKEVTLDVPAQIINGRTFIPLRRLVEDALDKKIFWDGRGLIVISDIDNIFDRNREAVLLDNIVASFAGTLSEEDVFYVDISYNFKGVFKGYLRNTSYEEPAIFLNTGGQTESNDEVKSIASIINNNKDQSTVKEIFLWMKNNLKIGDGEKFSRTGIEIIHSKIFTGCTDMGLAFATISRQKGIPTVFVQTARMDWVKKDVENSPSKKSITGHILCEVLLSDNNWYLVDTTAGKLFLNYDKNNFSLPDGYYTFAKSTDVFETGVNNMRSNNFIMLQLFKYFNVSKYSNPMYDYVNLNDGIRYKSREFNMGN